MPPNHDLPQKANITAVKPETPDTRTYTLALGNGNGFRSMPGQFNMLSLPGIGEAPISISSEPGRADSFDHTVRAVGDVTNALMSAAVGSAVWVRGPYGSTWPMELARGKH